ncbi:DUF1638 domain-containing protein [Pacificibacter marinus]|uniref:DUF1638 domain-containing protein n=1 Tax=Pacificibacter marinus TaxID=658057 RepID=UPI001C07C667|nr:DUF1638 domain-containing protein [Pacificibacter marinus]MBU2868993.1 DUF1638 domain-containing protein [Pacificibacter marinus]
MPDPDTQITDEALRDVGLLPFGAGKTLVIACGALAREVLAIINLNGLDHLTLTCLPAILHNTPKDIPQAVENAIIAHQDTYDHFLIAYGDCGTGGLLQATCDRLGAVMIDAPHCYAFFDGTDQFIARGEVTSFFLTDFLARQFDAFVWTPLGLNRYPDLRDMYFGNYENLVYLAQTDDADLLAKAKVCADRLGLKFEHRKTGYGDLTEFLTSRS